MESTLNESDVKSHNEEDISNEQMIVSASAAPKYSDDFIEVAFRNNNHLDLLNFVLKNFNSIHVTEPQSEESRDDLQKPEQSSNSLEESNRKISFFNTNDAIYLKIITKNKIPLYLPKGWLRNISPYFRAMLPSNYSESTKTELELEYDSHILSVIFEMITIGYEGINIMTQCLDRIITSNDVCELFHACSVFQLDKIQSICSEYFSSDEKIDQFISAHLLITVNLLDIDKIKGNIISRLSKNHTLFDKIDFQQISYQHLDYFLWDWPCIMTVLNKWTCCHDPTDKEFSVSKLYHMSFMDVPYKYIDDLTKIIGRLTLATEFKQRVLSVLAEVKILADAEIISKKKDNPRTRYHEFFSKEITRLRSEYPGENNKIYMKMAAMNWNIEQHKERNPDVHA